MQATFAEMQIAGMLPSLLSNRLGIPIKNLTLMLEKFKLADNGCWLWTGATSKGYGVVKIRSISNSILPVHRIAYQLVNGPVADDLDIHHKVEDGCVGRICGNPSHLQSATRKEHLAELSPGNLAYVNIHKTVCDSGHPFTVKNTGVINGRRYCRECCRLREQAKRDVALAAEGRTKFKWRKEHIKTVCKNGHDVTEESNIYVDGKGFRCCRGCRKMANDKVTAKRRYDLQTAKRRTAD